MKVPALFLATWLSLAHSLGGEILPVAVFDFTSRDEALKETAPKVSTLAAALLSGEEGLITLERAELSKALGEQELGLSGTVSGESAATVGQLTGAKVLVTGSLIKTEKSIVAVAKIIGVETGRVYGETASVGSPSDIQSLAETLAKRIAATILAKGKTLTAHLISLEERAKRLAEKYKPAEPTSIRVSLPEQHFGAPVADPAAETELLSILKQCGFEVIEAGSAKKPDVEVLGEAFSAFGLRKGQLVACKARIELKALRTSDKKVLYVGSRTTVSADIAEQTAAKTALEIAAVEIAERLLPALIKH